MNGGCWRRTGCVDVPGCCQLDALPVSDEFVGRDFEFAGLPESDDLAEEARGVGLECPVSGA